MLSFVTQVRGWEGRNLPKSVKCKRKRELTGVFIMALQRQTGCCTTDIRNPHTYGIQQTSETELLFSVALAESCLIITHSERKSVAPDTV